MKNFMRLFSLMMALLMTLTCTVFALNPDKNNESPTTETYDTYLYYDENSKEMSSFDLQDEFKTYKFDTTTFSYTTDPSKELANLNNKVDELIEQPNISSTDSSTSSEQQSAYSNTPYLISVDGGLDSASGGGFKWWFTPTCTSAIKPPCNITVQAYCYNGSGGYKYQGEKSIELGLTGWGQKYYFTTNFADTGYYYLKTTVTNYTDSSVRSSNTSTTLFNKKGIPWNFYYSTADNKLSEPFLGWPKGALYTRPSNLNTWYYNQYFQKNGVKLDSSLYNVHHIRPLAFGGSNDYNNLIHLPTALHTKVTSWFVNY